MLLLHQSLSPKTHKSEKEWCILPESFLLCSWDGEATWDHIHQSYTPVLENFSQELKEKSEEEVPVMLKVKICHLWILLREVERLFFFFLLQCTDFIFRSQSHFHWVTNFLHMQLGEEGWRGFPDLNERVLQRKLIYKTASFMRSRITNCSHNRKRSGRTIMTIHWQFEKR